MIVKLTQAMVNGYKIPEHMNVRKQELVDEGGTGLYLNVSYTGIKTYMFRYRSAQNGNKTTHVKLGLASDITLSQARNKVKKLRAEIALGDDPVIAKIKQKETPTYSEFMDNYFDYIKPRRRSYKLYRQMYDSHLKRVFGNMKVSQITKRDVQAFHNDLREQGLANGTCNRYLQLIKSSINYGINMEIIDIKRNPAVGIPLFPEEGRERYLSQDELTRLMPVLIADGGPISKVARMLLCTGCRLNEILQCRSEHIDIYNRVMVIPSNNAKSKKNDSIPLNAAAIQVLEECDMSTTYPFANPRTGKPYVSIKKGFQKLMKQAGIEGVTAHTLRHTAASLMINSGRSLYDVQKVLRHSSSQVTEKYAHLSKQTVMAASDTISDQLMRAASGS